MDSLRPDVLPQRTSTIRGRSGNGSVSVASDVFYRGAGDGDVAELGKNQRPVFLAGETADD